MGEEQIMVAYAIAGLEGWSAGSSTGHGGNAVPVTAWPCIGTECPAMMRLYVSLIVRKQLPPHRTEAGCGFGRDKTVTEGTTPAQVKKFPGLVYLFIKNFVDAMILCTIYCSKA
jgi:hypothetical protein